MTSPLQAETRSNSGTHAIVIGGSMAGLWRRVMIRETP